MKSGVYKITNLVNGKCYIGSSVNIKERWTEHKRDIRNEKHHNKYLEKSFHKYGLDNFKFEILSHCPKRKSSFKRIKNKNV